MPVATLDSGLKLSYTEQGNESGGVLLMLPGPTDSWLSYQPVLDHLPRRIRAIAVSQRGHGDSDKPPAGYTIEELAADAASFMDALGIERAVLAGHSGSCLVARRVALDQPNRVAGLVLEASPTTLADNPILQDFVAGVVSGLEDPIRRKFARAVITETSSTNVSPDVVSQLVGELLKVPSRVWRALFEDLLRYDDLAELGRIKLPTLLVWGTADSLVPRQMQDELMTRITRAELITYDGVGHTPRWDVPARFSADIAEFMQRLPR